MTYFAPINGVILLPLPHGWPDPFRPSLQRGHDFSGAFTGPEGLWIKFMDGSRYVVPYAQIVAMIPVDWPA